LKAKSWCSKSRLLCSAVVMIAASALLISAPVPVANAAPTGSSAQAAPAEIYGKLLSMEEKEIVSAAEAMPADKYSFAPTNGNFSGVRTFGQQVKHIAEANYHIMGGFGIEPGMNPKTIDGLKSKAEIVKALRDSFAFLRKGIDTMTAKNAFASTDAHQNTRAGSAAMALAHANDHYGQMVEYLRMNGIVPPASRK
jgi:uncharacterized damage-inducible protein DinB